jgi:hypothetical protein
MRVRGPSQERCRDGGGDGRGDETDHLRGESKRLDHRFVPQDAKPEERRRQNPQGMEVDVHDRVGCIEGDDWRQVGTDENDLEDSERYWGSGDHIQCWSVRDGQFLLKPRWCAGEEKRHCDHGHHRELCHVGTEEIVVAKPVRWPLDGDPQHHQPDSEPGTT